LKAATCHLECTSMRLTEAHNAAIAAKPMPARPKMSSAVLNCIRF